MATDFTHVVRLWLDNEEHLYHCCTKAAGEEWENAEGLGRKDKATNKLADRIKKIIENSCPVRQGLFKDLIDYALSEVDWNDIASSFIDIEDEDEDEDEDEELDDEEEEEDLDDDEDK